LENPYRGFNWFPCRDEKSFRSRNPTRENPRSERDVTMDMTKIIEMFETISSRMDRIEKQYDRIERKIDEEFSKPKYEMYNEVEKRRLELRMETYAKTLNERMDQITLWGLIKKWLG
jgi:hypothetical protein